MGYTKLFSEIIGSTIWREPDHVRLVWITMLACRDSHHTVQVSIPGLADFARVSLEKCEDALERLSSPDPYSRTTDHEGRRIEKCEGGWYILNAEKYRKKMNLDERREYKKLKQQEYRARDKGVDNPVDGSGHSGTTVTQKEKEKEEEKDLSPSLVLNLLGERHRASAAHASRVIGNCQKSGGSGPSRRVMPTP